MQDQFILYLDPNFPLDDIERISRFLSESRCLVPGFHPPTVGLLDVAGMYYAREVDSLQTVMLPDRNLVTRMAKIARDGIADPDKPTRIAAALMAYCQCMDIVIEPSISYHEFAYFAGNEEALRELGWFRAADRANPTVWCDLALGRSNEFVASEPVEIEFCNLAFPLHRWRRNYITALKIAELNLSGLEPHTRMLTLLDWMRDDFIFAGPAAILAAFYLAPNAPRKRVFKRLRSPDREKALAGVRNEAWDITHLSDFGRRVNEDRDQRWIFATADSRLAQLARDQVPQQNEEDQEAHITRIVRQWWPAPHRQVIVARLIACMTETASRHRKHFGDEAITRLIAEGENRVRDWVPH